MKKIFILLILLLLCNATPSGAEVVFPAHYDNFVNDYAKVLNAADTAAMGEALRELYRKTGIHFVAVTIPSLKEYGASGMTVRSYAAELFDSWGVGDGQKNNGILLLFSQKDRTVWIEMGLGYNNAYNQDLQYVVDDLMLPYFREGLYSEGLAKGVVGVIGAVSGPVAWLKYHLWTLLFGGLFILCGIAGISCIIAGKKGWGFAFFAAAFFALLTAIRSVLPFGGGPFGGGRSGGGGAGGSW